MRKWAASSAVCAAAALWSGSAAWPPRPLPRVELRGSESGGSFVEDTPGWAPHLITLFLTEKNPDGPWQSARQHIEWAHRPAHSYAADGSGCYVILAHPTLRQFDQITALDLDAMEINHSGNAEPFEELWDRALTWRALRKLPPLWGTGADDTHSSTDIDRSWTALRLKSLSEAEVKAALRRGAFYASNGPVIRDIQASGASITVYLDAPADVRWLRSGQFGTGSPEVGSGPGRNRCLRFDRAATSSTYTLNAADGTTDPAALFVRCVITTAELGKAAQTQPFVIRSASELDNPYPSEGAWHKGMTHNHTDLLEGSGRHLAEYAAAYATRGFSAAFETPYDYWVTPMTRYPPGRTPEIGDVSPRVFAAGDRAAFEITGSSFHEGCEVLVDGKPAQDARRVSETAIRAALPGGLAPGYHELTVRNPDGLQDTRTQGLLVRAPGARTNGWTFYTTANAPLGSRHVYSLAAAPRGGVWAGTNRGLNYFDGSAWRLFREEPGGALDDTTYDMDATSPDGTCWFSCFRGVGALHPDGTRERWNWKEAGLPSKQINQILRLGGATYISTHNRQGFSILENGTWSRIALPETARGLVTSIVPGPDGRIWLGTTQGVLSWDRARGGEGWRHYHRANSGLPDDFVRRMAFDRRGRLWLGTATRSESDAGGLCVYDQGRWTVYSPGNSRLPERRVWSVYVDAADRVWAATSKGATCLDSDGRWSVFDAVNSGLVDNMVTDIVQDTTGDVWFATASGISRMGAAVPRNRTGAGR